MVVIADQRAAEAEKAWQSAEDRVDDLLGEHNTLLSQIAAMAEYFKSHADGWSANATEQQQIQGNLEQLGKALVDSQSEMYTIQGAKQDTAAALAEKKLAAAKQATTAATAASEFQKAAANLAAAKASVGRMQQQLSTAKAKHDEAANNLAQQQQKLAAAAMQLQGQKDLLHNATAAANATQELHRSSVAELSAAVSKSLDAQKALSGAMSRLQNLKATESSLMTDVDGAKQQVVNLEGQLASAAAALAAAKVCYWQRIFYFNTI